MTGNSLANSSESRRNYLTNMKYFKTLTIFALLGTLAAMSVSASGAPVDLAVPIHAVPDTDAWNRKQSAYNADHVFKSVETDNVRLHGPVHLWVSAMAVGATSPALIDFDKVWRINALGANRGWSLVDRNDNRYEQLSDIQVRACPLSIEPDSPSCGKVTSFYGDALRSAAAGDWAPDKVSSVLPVYGTAFTKYYIEFLSPEQSPQRIALLNSARVVLTPEQQAKQRDTAAAIAQANVLASAALVRLSKLHSGAYVCTGQDLSDDTMDHRMAYTCRGIPEDVKLGQLEDSGFSITGASLTRVQTRPLYNGGTTVIGYPVVMLTKK